MKTALLLSGGMDSVSIAYWRRPDLGIKHEVVSANINELGSGDLVGTQPASEAPASEWWPYRNQFLLTVAAMVCYREGMETLLMGALRTDGFHADGTTEFIAGMNELLSIQEGVLIIEAPAIDLDAVELVRTSKVPDEILSWSHSCHVAEYACGFCRGCRKHYETMERLNGYTF